MPSINHFMPNFHLFFIMFVPAVIGIVCHEVAHGYVAYKLGDPTAKILGRLTLNPLKHIDPTGLLVFVMTALLTDFVIGWAKPVPVDARHFKNPRQGMMAVAFAGPLTNFLLALAFAIIATLTATYSQEAKSFLHQAAIYGVIINCTLGWFNLMPIPPLDGSHILMGVLPRELAMRYASIGRYGMIILVGFLYFGLFSLVMRPLVYGTVEFLFTMVSFLQPQQIL